MKHWPLDVRGLRLHIWEHTGAPHATPPIVCLHGWLDQGLAFARVVEGAPGRWLLPDQRGFGASPLGPGSYPHFPDYVADLDALVAYIGGPIDLVGHSMGGTVAAMYAGARPDAVRRLVLVEGLGALPSAEREMLDRTRAFLDGLRDPPALPAMKSPQAAAERLLRRHPGLTAAHAGLLAGHGVRQDETGHTRWRFAPEHLVRSPYPFMEGAFQAFAQAISAPTLVLWASESWYPEQARTERVAWIPDHRQRVLDGGHMLPYDAPDALRDAVLDHIRR